MLAALGAGCFSPPTADCALECGAGGACPSGFTCLADDFCHEAGDDALCVGDDEAGPRPPSTGVGGGAAGGLAFDQDPGEPPPQFVTVELPSVADTDIQLEASDDNNGGRTHIVLDGGLSSDATHFVGLLRFDLSSIPVDALLSAAPELIVANGDNNLESGSVKVWALVEDWDELDATWDQRASGASWSTSGAGTGSRSPSPIGEFSPSLENVEHTVPLDSTTVQLWIQVPGLNRGVSLDVGHDAGTGVSFYSRNYETDPALRPRLRVSYCNYDCE